MFRTYLAVMIAALAFGVGTAAAAETSQGLKADGLRLQAMAQRYQWLQGVKADGMRYQAAADYYAAHKASVASPVSSSSFDWQDAGIGAGVAAAALLSVTLIVGFARRGKGELAV